MARKISKHSRAARRGEIDIDGNTTETNSLDNVPRAERTDVIGPMIRASVQKNEQLLSDKLTKKRRKAQTLSTRAATSVGGVHKKSRIVSKTVRNRRRKGVIVDGRLASKIEASIQRHDETRRIRKAGWDKVNAATRASVEVETHKKTTDFGIAAPTKDDDKMAEDSDDDENDEIGEEGSGWAELTGKPSPAEGKKEKNKKKFLNAFELLDEVEA